MTGREGTPASAGPVFIFCTRGPTTENFSRDLKNFSDRQPGAQARPEVPGPADGLVHGGHAEAGQFIDAVQVGAGRTGDDYLAHQLSLSVTCGNTRMSFCCIAK